MKIDIEKIEVGNWTEIDGYSSRGRRVKCWLEKIFDGTIYIYKEPKELQKPKHFVTQEIWTEYIAYKIGTFLGLNIPEAIPAQYNLKNINTYGILIKSFITKEESLIEAQDFFANTTLTHNLEDIKHILTLKGFTVGNSWENYKKMLIFDCLIGNNDRHDENWGFCFNGKTKNVKLSPIYDNASCLASGYDEDKVLELLSNEEKCNKYIYGPKSRPPNLYLSKEDKNRYNHYEIIQYLIENENDMKNLIDQLLEKNYIDFVDDIIKKIQQLDLPKDYQISDNRRNVILKILHKRREKLKELV